MSSDVEKRISDAIWYISALYEDARDNSSRLYEQETYRVIILYVTSVIEALLFEKYEELEQKITVDEYKEASALPTTFCNPRKGEIVICRRLTVQKTEQNIGLYELLDFLIDKVITRKTAVRIKKINSLRNSFHFRKPGNSTCKIADVDESLQLLEMVVENCRKK